MAGRKVRKFKIVFICLLLLLVLLIAFAVFVVKFYIGPAMVMRQFENFTSVYWDGHVSVEKVNFSLLGNLYLEEVAFFGPAGRQWLWADQIKVDLSDWPGLKPGTSEVKIVGLEVQVYRDKDRVTLPLRRIGTDTKTRIIKAKKLRNITIEDSLVTLSDSLSGNKILFDELDISVVRKSNVQGTPSDIYEFSLSRDVPDDSNTISVSGTYNLSTSDANLSIQIADAVSMEQAPVIFSFLNIPSFFYRAQGDVNIDAKINGNLRDTESLWPKGIVVLNNGIFKFKDVVARQVSASIKLDGRRFDIDGITAAFFGGRLEGSLFIEKKKSEPAEFAGQFVADGVDMTELTASSAKLQKFSKGKGAARYKFGVKAGNLQSLQAEGIVFLDDADLWSLPIVRYIFDHVGLLGVEPVRMSDAEASFTMAGPVVTMSRAHISNRLSAIETEPGGIINLQSGDIDVHVVAVPLKDVNRILQRVPVVNLFSNLKDKIIRLRIKGNWSQPPGKLIKKEPLKDIKDGTAQFIANTAKSGGQFTDTMVKTFGLIFKGAQKNKAP